MARPVLSRGRTKLTSCRGGCPVISPPLVHSGEPASQPACESACRPAATCRSVVFFDPPLPMHLLSPSSLPRCLRAYPLCPSTIWIRIWIDACMRQGLTHMTACIMQSYLPPLPSTHPLLSSPPLPPPGQHKSFPLELDDRPSHPYPLSPAFLTPCLPYPLPIPRSIGQSTSRPGQPTIQSAGLACRWVLRVGKSPTCPELEPSSTHYHPSVWIDAHPSPS